MNKDSRRDKRQPELHSDSAINPGFGTVAENEADQYFMDGSMGNSIVDFDETDAAVDDIDDRDIIQYTKDGKRS
ncbi:hypothetical protein [Pseudalkalibacillus salsuginis]|uniref:hypothetical protein n=1 Tax=Pseudalkalibacillus salsuginis TaxID=2910972 RepID=UPI001F38C69F|nr:hypothetical protein [Pseudalkalibacillus salsuginis]MCF6409306.1 hypothetical protein [Pseudalkalibacillus salsuginis]